LGFITENSLQDKPSKSFWMRSPEAEKRSRAKFVSPSLTDLSFSNSEVQNLGTTVFLAGFSFSLSLL
jgi:hypothetical protein